MQKPLTATQPKARTACKVRLSPTLVPVVNAVLTRRFVEKRSEEDVLKSFAAEGIIISRARLSQFIRRLLYVLPAEQARQIGVNRELLALIRRRHHLPVEPRTGKMLKIKPRRKFDVRHRNRRRITLEPKAQRPVSMVGRTQSGSITISNQPTTTGIFFEPSAEEIAEFHKFNRTQLAEVNKEARRKIRAVDRWVITNMRGACQNYQTKEDFSPEDLQQQFGLTYAEAQSCFLTID